MSCTFDSLLPGVLVPGAGYSACVGSGSSMCSTLAALGATDEELAGVGTGVVSASQLLDCLTGNNTSPIQVQSSGSDIFLGALGSVADAVSDPVGGTGIVQQIGAGITNATDIFGKFKAWLAANWIWIVGVLFVGLLLIVWAYGGFRGIL